MRLGLALLFFSLYFLINGESILALLAIGTALSVIYKHKSRDNEKDLAKKLQQVAIRKNDPQQKEYFSALSTAERLKKEKKFEQAETQYLRAIEAGEDSLTWQKFGPSLIAYKELAELYSNKDKQKEALAILERLDKFNQNHPSLNKQEIKALKDKINKN